MMNPFSRSGIQSRALDLNKCLFIFTITLVLLLPAYSYGVQFSLTGDYDVRLINLNNADDLNSDFNDNMSYADLRFRLQTNLKINENTRGVAAFEVGHIVFGIDSDDASRESVPGSDSINLKLKSAYIDFTLPNRVSTFIVGLQPFYIFDGLIANEDAAGISYLLEAERTLQISYVNIYESKVDEKYLNETNPARRSQLLSIFYEREVLSDDTIGMLFAYYIDKNAVFTETTTDGTDISILDITYSERNAMYLGLGYKWLFHGADMSFDLLYEKGSKKHIDDSTGDTISKKSLGYLIDFTAKRSFETFDTYFEFLLATGDDNKEDRKDQEFMSVDGLTNYYDRAYILTGYISKDDADEKEGIFDNAVYNLTNVVFFKLGSEFRFDVNKRFDLSVMYAMNDEKVVTLSGEKARDIGAEIDATFTVDIFDTFYNTGGGLLFSIFGAYFLPGGNYQFYDGSSADNVHLVGTALEYTF